MADRNGYRELSMEGMREAVMDELAVQYSRSNLEMEEYDDRCGRAAKSASRRELMELLADLPPLAPTGDPGALGAGLPVPSGSGALYRVNRGRVPERDVLFNVFSGSDRKGVFDAPRSMQVINVFGGSDIDLSRAAIPPEGCVINVFCVFGGCDVTLPRGVNADVRGIGIFGGFGKKVDEDAEAGAPTIRVNGIAVFGGCDVKTSRK